jgi:hypothetical protein
MCLSHLAAAEIKANFVYAIDINEGEVVVKCSFWQQAVFASWMTELYSQAQRLQRNHREVRTCPLLS